MKNNNEIQILKIKGTIFIFTIVLVIFGFYMLYPYQHNAEIVCSTGDIDTDYKMYWVNEKVKVEYPSQVVCATDNYGHVDYSKCDNGNPIYMDEWKSKSLPQYFQLFGIDGMNCNIKVSGTYNNMQVLELMYNLMEE